MVQLIKNFGCALYRICYIRMSLSLQCSVGITVSSRVGLGLVGVMLVALSVVASLGLLSFLRVKATLIIIEVVPFLVLAVGTDNLFILTHAYEVSNIVITHLFYHLEFVQRMLSKSKQGTHVSTLIGDALGEVAPSILLTSLTETMAFLLGMYCISSCRLIISVLHVWHARHTHTHTHKVCIYTHAHTCTHNTYCYIVLIPRWNIYHACCKNICLFCWNRCIHQLFASGEYLPTKSDVQHLHNCTECTLFTNPIPLPENVQ